MSKNIDNEYVRDNRTILISLILAAVVAVVYWQVVGHGFTSLDDRLYIMENPNVASGLSSGNVAWAFTAFHASNWHPLTWISHMIDCQIFGMRPGMHHFVSMLFHMANSLLLFLVLRRMTGMVWRSAFVAFLFALHPLHVESVAWAAERKDVLSTFFWMLAMWCYYRYAWHSGISRYITVLIVFALGLMAKPMVVTLPFVFLLLDFWPLQRLQYGKSALPAALDAGKSVQTDPSMPSKKGRSKRKEAARSTSSPQNDSLLTLPAKKPAMSLILEKVPFFILAAASGAITMIAQKRGGAVASMEALAFGERLANAVVAYALYLWKTVWPLHLAFFYPHPETIPWWHVALAAIVLASVTAGAVLSYKRMPYLLVGWLWYLGTLVPVIGIVQVGGQAMADRYTYIPLMGIFIMVSWGAADLAFQARLKRSTVAAAACSTLAALAVFTWIQIGYWHDDAKLAAHAIDVTKGNYLAYNILGLALESEGRLPEAVDQYDKAIEAKPRYADAHVNMGVTLSTLGRFHEAAVHYEEALRMKPDMMEAHFNLGELLLRTGRVDEAIRRFEVVLRSGTATAEAHNALGVAMAGK
ncbi:MAG TPA: tetratricopeptide repeat protein, partial [Deltaproteobacteria bacterium]|nr:tetratricopeptide repeat protein [Deltaproteobacteria bacterium]